MKKKLNNKLIVDNRQLTSSALGDLQSMVSFRLLTLFRYMERKLTVDSVQLTETTLHDFAYTIKRVLSTVLCQLSIVLLVACGPKETAHEHDEYTCPMHPTVISDRPGVCPVCGMDLVRKARPGEEVQITEDLNKLLRSPNETVVASIETVKGEYKTMPVPVVASGVVTYDSRYLYTIPSRIGGRLEKVFLKYAYQPVRKGQKVAEIYSPELVTAQRELLYLLDNDTSNQDLIDGARRKLLLSGVSERQLDELVKRKEAFYTFSIYSPHDGYVVTGEEQSSASAPTAASSPAPSGGGMGGDGMGGAASAASAFNNVPGAGMQGSLPREGSYIAAGQTLFKIVNTAALRVELDLPGATAGAVKKGDEVLLDLGSGKEEKAAVDFVQPFFSEGEEFLKVRVYTKKVDNLAVGSLVKATIHLDKKEALWVPKEAVLDLGLERIVFVKERGVFRPRTVTTGLGTDAWIEIKQGLASADEVARNAQFLVDSESFIKRTK
jgi:multidrug efflux pump subunit AcrA (membrane-fusion protein)